MVSVLASSAVDRGFESWSGQTKDYKIGIYCFLSKHTAIINRYKTWHSFCSCKLIMSSLKYCDMLVQIFVHIHDFSYAKRCKVLLITWALMVLMQTLNMYLYHISLRRNWVTIYRHWNCETLEYLWKTTFLASASLCRPCGNHGHDIMVVRFTTFCAFSANHH